MKHSFILALFIVLMQVFAWSSAAAEVSVDDLFNQGNQAYSNGEYDRAITLYREAIARYGLSANLLNNLGSSYAQNGQYGFAILQFERGLRLDPGNDNLTGNLNLVKNHIGLFPDKSGFLKSLATTFTFNQWITYALICYLFLALTGFFLYLFPRKRFLWGIALSFTAVATATVFCGIQQHHDWIGGIIVTSESTLLLSPFNGATARGTLPEGALVTCREKYNDFCYINDDTGHSGWIALTDYRPVNIKATRYSHEYAE